MDYNDEIEDFEVVCQLDRRVKQKEVLERYSICKTTLNTMIENETFPAPHVLPGGRNRYWWETQLIEYENKCKAQTQPSVFVRTKK